MSKHGSNDHAGIHESDRLRATDDGDANAVRSQIDWVDWLAEATREAISRNEVGPLDDFIRAKKEHAG